MTPFKLPDILLYDETLYTYTCEMDFASIPVTLMLQPGEVCTAP